jgi:hypothetical protein
LKFIEKPQKFRGVSVNGPSLLPEAGAWRPPGRPPRHLLLAVDGRGGHLEDALLPLPLSLILFSLSRTLSSSPLFFLHAHSSSPRMAAALRRRSASPRAPPRCPAGPPRPPLPFPSKNRDGAPRIAATVADSTAGSGRRRAKIHRRRPLPGPADLAVELHGEPRPSWPFSPPPSCGHRRRSGAGRLPGIVPRRPRPAAGQVDLVQRGLAGGPVGPSGQSPWVKMTPVQKVLCNLFYFRKLYNFVKCISIDLCIRKMCMIYQNVQKIEIYLLMSNSCIVNQH